MSTLLRCRETELAAFVNKLMDGHVKYGLGKKASLSADPQQVEELDCSGFVRYVLYNIFNITTYPGGSWWQNKYFVDKHFRVVDYASEAPLHDSMLRAAYYPPERKNGKRIKIGHIWFVLNGETIESFGGGTRHGPGRRPWDTRGLKRSVKACYRVAEVVPAGFNVWFVCFDRASVPELWE